MAYDAFLLLSFGGPEHPDDVLPFLRNVTRGRAVPPERLAEVAEHYQQFGGVSPINQQCRDLLAAIRSDFAAHGVDLPVYWGNRNWTPLLADTLATMRDDGVRRALALATSAYGGYSSCRQYHEDIAAARAAVGGDAPVVDKLRHFADHPGFVHSHAEAVRAAVSRLDQDLHKRLDQSPDKSPDKRLDQGLDNGLEPARRGTTRLVFTAHSIPVSMAAAAGPPGRQGPVGRYEAQLRETAGLVAAASGVGLPYDLVWQSRSGPPHVPWLGPDVNDHLEALADTGVTAVVVSPIGFVSDHLEVAWDLDTEAAATARKLGMEYARAATPGTHPAFVAMVRELVQERLAPEAFPRRGLGTLPAWDACPVGCCPPPRRQGHS